MSNAAKEKIHHDDEEGVAEGAASLGPDGGPAGVGAADLADIDGDFDDDAWLDEELTEEELAALGEEDFDEEDLIADAEFDDAELDGGELDGDAFSAAETIDDADATFLDDELTEEELAALEEADDFSLPEDIREDESDSHDAGSAPQVEADHVETGHVETGGALVAPSAGVPDAGDFGAGASDFADTEIDHRPVPRISIHAFCETPATTALIEKAAADRRLSKAHLTMHMGGISKAVDQFKTASTPNLIILETLATGAEIFAKLGELAEVCDPSSKVVIIGQVNDIILYRELIRQGISEYIVAPQSPLQIIKMIADLYTDPSAPPIGRTLAFVGARGGVGSSTLAHNVAWCAAEEHRIGTILLDLDLPFGTASLDFDQEASAGLYEALSSPERLDDVLLDRLLQKHTEHLSLFTAPSLLDRDYDVDDQAYETVLDVVRGSTPTVVVDVPHIWCAWSKRLLTSADEIIITATPDLAAFRNTKQLVDILGAARPNDAPPTLVINQFDTKLSPVRPEQFAEHVGLKASQVFVWEPHIFGAAATNAAPIVEVSPKSKAAVAMRELTAQLLGRDDANLLRPKFSLSSLFKKSRS
ncbi:MAG: pilus assembly protein CpaE [Pseudomonadota bacterium]